MYNFFLIFKVRVHLWDLSGSPEYIDVRNELYINTDAIFLVFDVTNFSTFENMENWLKEVQKYSSGNPELIVVANKVFPSRDNQPHLIGDFLKFIIITYMNQ